MNLTEVIYTPKRYYKLNIYNTHSIEVLLTQNMVKCHNS